MLSITHTELIAFEREGFVTDVIIPGILHISNGEDMLIVSQSANQSGASHIAMIWSPIDDAQYTRNISRVITEQGFRFGTRCLMALEMCVIEANLQIKSWLGEEEEN